MSEKKMNELIGRAIADPDFRAALIADPDKAIKEAGYELTDEEIASLREIDLKARAEELGERLSKSGTSWSLLGRVHFNC
jgi:acyl-CoA hydrolase